MRISSFVACAFLSCQLLAQSPELNRKPEATFREAVKSYKHQEFAAASDLFAQYISQSTDIKPEAIYLQAVARIKSGETQGVTQVEQFITNYPSHPLAGRGYYELGTYFFQKGNYQKALTYYSQANPEQLSGEEHEQRLFGLGYAYTKTGDTENALVNLEQVLTYRGPYFDQASYYLGRIYYEEENYGKALSVLEPIDGKTSEFTDDVIVLIAGIYFHTEQYQRLFAYAPERLNKSVSFKNKQLNKLLGEAYFEEKQFDKAAERLQRYLDLTGNRAEAATFFKLGYAYFEISQNKNAIENFKKAGLEKGKLGQVSSFYLGQLYLKEENLSFAYSAFKTVAESEEQNEMTEEASFTLGKVNFKREQFGEAIEDFVGFLEAYPKSNKKGEANELLAESYLRTSNYDQAIAHLEAIRNKTKPLRQAYQKVVFQKAQLLYNDSRFGQAVIYFEKAVDFPEDRLITAQSYYLAGDSYSMLNQTTKAEDAYRKCVNLNVEPYSARSRYGWAYIAYNNKDFPKAQRYFRGYLDNSSSTSDFYEDALIRLADCYYVQKDYNRALSYYDQVDEQSQNGYVTYQKGLIFRLQGELARAEVAFQQVANNRSSGYGDNALFQLAETEIEQADFQKALVALESLINDYPESNLLPYARNQQAICFFNLGQYTKAQQVYEFVLSNYINHEVANSSLLGLQEVMKKGVEVSDFDAYMEAYQKANPDDGSLEVVAFESAKTYYYNQKYEEAIKKLKGFQQKYPGSGFAEDISYFLADSYYRSEQWEPAIQQFGELIEQQSVAYTGRALDKRGAALMALGKHKEAIGNYRMLLQRARNQKETFNANEGLMSNYFTLNNKDSSLYFANQILENEWKPVNAESAIWLVKAKIYLSEDDYAQAMDELIRVVNNGRNERAAEAKYLLAKVYYLQENYKRSLEMLFDLNKNFGSYLYWVGKSFLLIADNYLALDELLQAKATAESIVKNATLPEIKQEAEQKLITIRQREEELIVPDSLANDTIR